jgi:hypothetical protein
MYNYQSYNYFQPLLYMYSSIFHLENTTDISRVLGSLCYIRTVFYLNCLTAQLSYEGRAAVEGANWYF